MSAIPDSRFAEARLAAAADALVAREVDRRAGLLDCKLTEFHDTRVQLALARYVELGGRISDVLTIYIRTLSHWPD